MLVPLTFPQTTLSATRKGAGREGKEEFCSGASISIRYICTYARSRYTMKHKKSNIPFIYPGKDHTHTHTTSVTSKQQQWWLHCCSRSKEEMGCWDIHHTFGPLWPVYRCVRRMPK